MESFDPFSTCNATRMPDRTVVRIMDHETVDARTDSLSAAETKRVSTLKHAKKRRDLERSLIAVRQALAELTGTTASEIAIAHDPQGAPSLSSSPGLRLSISRTTGWSALALSPLTVLGVDIELVRAIDWTAMQNMVCTVEEMALLSTLDAYALPAFYRLWTGKEAIMKAAGEGFRMNARSISLPDVFMTGAEPHAQISGAHGTFSVNCTQYGDLMISLATVAG